MKRLLPLGLLLLASSTWAHVSLQDATAPAGSYQRLTFKVGHGCDTEATHTFTVKLPEGIYNAKPMPKAGWELKTESGAYEKPFDNHGTVMKEGVRTITWSGGNLPNEFYDEFVISVKLSDDVGKRIFPVTQLCEKGRLDWVDVASEANPKPKSPAPVLEVIAKPQGTDEHGHGAAKTDAKPEANPHAGHDMSKTTEEKKESAPEPKK